MQKALILVLLLLVERSRSERTLRCDVSSDVICKLDETLNINITHGSLGLDANSNLVWLNRYQPTWTRWSQLCTNPSYQYHSSSQCLNSHDCDASGVCRLRFASMSDDRSVIVELRDNVDARTESPRFTPDLRFINVSWDLETLASNDVLVLDHTERLDALRSKPNRMLMNFQIENVDEPLPSFAANLDCKTTNSNMFGVRYEKELEKLFLTFNSSKIPELKKGCYLMKLTVKRTQNNQESRSDTDSTSVLMLTINDNRFDRPIFDYPIYNFTMDENTPLGTTIGQLNAVYFSGSSLNADETGSMRYRIVPFAEDVDQMLANDEAAADIFSSALPIRIDSESGRLSVRLNVDREKFVSGDKLGLIRFNVEASYASTYSYARVNILVRDMNDNAPLVRMRPVSQFAKSTSHRQSNETDSILNLYVNEDTPVNQILAYVGLYDPDSAENGTIRSVDMTLVNAKKPSIRCLKQRRDKLERMKLAGVRQELVSEIEAELDMLVAASSNSLPNQNDLPVKMATIGDKLFTMQLSKRLNFNWIESYSIEMRIRDNGTRPQLESKTRLSVNVLGNNKYAPVFVNPQNTEIEIIDDSSNTNLSEPIFRFEAIDLDDEKNGQVKYKFHSNPLLSCLKPELDARSIFESTFDLNANNGQLRLLKPLDREQFTVDSFDMLVTAIDQAEPSHKRFNATYKLTVRLVDSNDNSPKFSTNKLELTVNIANKTGLNTRFVKISPPIDLVDSDSFGANSANFLNVNLNRARENLFENAIYLDENIKYDDVTCFKSFNLDLVNLNASSNRHPFLVMVENEPDLAINFVSCKIAVWIDLELLNKQQSEQTYTFVLKADDYGIHDSEDSDTSSLLEFTVQINLSDTVEPTCETIEIDSGSKRLVDLEAGLKMSSLVKLTRNEIDSKIKKTDYTQRFRVEENRLIAASDEPIEPGVYIIDLLTPLKSLKQIELVIRDGREDSREQFVSLLKGFKSQMANILGNVEPKFRSNMDRLSTLTHFQSLLFGSGSVSSSDLVPNGTSMWSILLSNRSTFVKFIAVTILVSFIVLSLLVCCILLIIRRNCSEASQKQTDDLKKELDGNRNLNVIDDEESGGSNSQEPQTRVKVMSKLSRLSDGFARLIVCEESSKQTVQNTTEPSANEKVNRYLDALQQQQQSVVVSFKQTTPKSDLMSASSTSPSSSDSVVDSKKNLIISAAHPTQQQTSVCTLSTTSSSCISDEGCYGSSDFSSDKDGKQQQYKQLIVMSKSAYNSKSSQLPTKIQQQQNYYINNLSRFEKIYNDLGNKPNSDDRISPYLVKPTQQVDSSNSSVLSAGSTHNNNNVQVVTSISGSYV